MRKYIVHEYCTHFKDESWTTEDHANRRTKCKIAIEKALSLKHSFKSIGSRGLNWHFTCNALQNLNRDTENCDKT